MRWFLALVALLALPLTLASQQQAIEGTVEIITEDRYDRTSVERPHVKDDSGRIHLVPPSARGLRKGQRVRLRGNQVEVLRDAPVARVVPTNGTVKVLCLLVTLRDAPNPAGTNEQCRSMVQGAGVFWNEVSYGRINYVQIDVVGPFPANAGLSECAYSIWSNDAKQAARARGVPVETYTNYVTVAPSSGACQWWGLGGGQEAWINGNMQPFIAQHEMGHDWGFGHAHGYPCDGGTFCQYAEYGDCCDVMGSNTGHTSPYYKEMAGWMTPRLVTASGTYTLRPVSKAPDALKIDLGNGYRYYIDFHDGQGQDGNVVAGVMIRSCSTVTGCPTQRDMFPGDNFYQPVLYPGQQPFSENGITINSLTWDANSATVNISLPGSQPTPAPRPGDGLFVRVY